MLVNSNESFVFPSQVQQVFYFDDFSNPWWKVILHKESHNKHVFLDTYGEYISTNEYGSVLDARRAMPNAPTTLSNVGAILFSTYESLLLNDSKQLSLERQSQGRNFRR
jgi:hypothetical protein